MWSDRLLWDTVFHFLINCAPIKIKGTRRVNGGRVMADTFLSSSGLLCLEKAGGHLVYCSAVAKGYKFFGCCVYSGFASSLSPHYPTLLRTKDKSSSWAPDHIPNTGTLSQLQGSWLGLTLTPQLSDKGGVVGVGHGSLIPRASALP